MENKTDNDIKEEISKDNVQNMFNDFSFRQQFKKIIESEYVHNFFLTK